MSIRGIRGATTVSENSAAAILSGTEALLLEMIAANDLRVENIAMALFTTSPDLGRAFPAAAARKLGWDAVPLICARELDVEGALPHCVRVLLLVNSAVEQIGVKHVYLGDAAHLRPDLAS